MALIKQSTAYTRMFLMVDSADHLAGKTGLAVTVVISKAGGAFGAATGATVTEVSGGWYKIALTAGNTDTLGELAFRCTATGADPTDFVDQVSARLHDDLASASALALVSADVAAVQADASTPFSRLTAAPALYLDNLNVGGLVASQAEVTAIQNNTRVVVTVPEIIR